MAGAAAPMYFTPTKDGVKGAYNTQYSNDTDPISSAIRALAMTVAARQNANAAARQGGAAITNPLSAQGQSLGSQLG